MGRRALKYLPERPPPEVDIKIVEVLDMNAMAGGDGGVKKAAKNCVGMSRFVTPSHPAPGASPIRDFIGRINLDCLMAVVGRIAQADDHRHMALDPERLGVLLGDRAQEEG